ncbi:ABC transporter substrate-binding protein [Actinorhabdospora filicis]|uniref:ABC transporter substrate-binding protein n=1 Tax=Actinorhabdospora filicis TaxID=1785913 RepID=A0A9W6SJ06_9ACTN|nr:MCE family protein [Actinorhabdospora filicis]GLZ76845.1 ABC transporter substrate-binding protein [Actinorhabdospora filicis]
MRTPSTARAAVKFGVFAVVTLVALALLTESLGGFDLPGGVAYRARFTDVTGVLAGDDVRIAGVKAGEVTSVELVQDDGGNYALVGFRLDSASRKLPGSVNATIRYRNLVGQRYLALTEAPGDAAPLQPGATIPLTQTHPALDLTALFNGFRPLFSALNAEDVNKVSYEIVQVLQGEGGTLASLLNHTGSLTSALADRDAVIGRVITNLNTVLGTVAQRDDELSTAIARLQEFVSGLADDRVVIGQSIATIGQLADATQDLLADARPSLKADIGALGELANNLTANSDAIETALARLPYTYANLTRTGAHGSWFNFYLCNADGTVTLPLVGPVNPATLNSPKARCR